MDGKVRYKTSIYNLPRCLLLPSVWPYAVQSTEGASRRAVLPLETSQPSVFAIGDVRAGSTKRVASAVGEGAAVVAQIHSVLAAA
jgi:thioredoxin reductase